MNRVKAVSSTLAYLSLLIATATNTVMAESDDYWSYEGQSGPQHWAQLNPANQLCSSGLNQSPLNINGSLKSPLFTLKVDYAPVPLQIVNNGHTIQLDYATLAQDERHKIAIDGKQYLLPSASQFNSGIHISGEYYPLKQLHFHSPSEHQINGRQFVLEAHLVHANAAGQLAVVALLFNEGKPHDEIARLWSFMPAHAGPRLGVAGQRFDVNQLLPTELTYYHYRGSLTTPPCSEGVRWFVLKPLQQVSNAQVRQFLTAVGSNSRPIQPRNARFLLATP